MLGNLEFVFFREILLLDWAEPKTSCRVFFQFLKQGPAYKKEGPHPNKGSNQQYVKISNQKKARLILQSRIYVFII